eukprot:3696729-Prymnesium_polylepis.1
MKQNKQHNRSECSRSTVVKGAGPGRFSAAPAAGATAGDAAGAAAAVCHEKTTRIPVGTCTLAPLTE